MGPWICIYNKVSSVASAAGSGDPILRTTAPGPWYAPGTQHSGHLGACPSCRIQAPIPDLVSTCILTRFMGTSEFEKHSSTRQSHTLQQIP